MADSWSYSKLADFEKCKKYFWLKHEQKIPEPQRPLPAGKTEHANDRGTRLHQSAEDYVSWKNDRLDHEVDKYFGPQIDLLRTMYKEGLVSLEGEWGLSANWEAWPWNGQWVDVDDVSEWTLPVKKITTLPQRADLNTIYKVGKKHHVWTPPWLRMKLDAMVLHDEATATVIDYKSGRKFGNEVKHGEQLQLYQLAAFMRYPKLQTVYAELWYLDQDEVTSVKFNRPMGLRYREKFTKRGDAILECGEWKPNPNKFTCKWCQYGPWGSNHCPEGVKP